MPLQKVAVSSAAFAAALAFQGCVRSNTEPADPDCPMATEEKCTTNENCYWFDKQIISNWIRIWLNDVFRLIKLQIWHTFLFSFFVRFSYGFSSDITIIHFEFVFIRNTTSNMCKSRQTAGNECLSDDACLSGQCFLPTGNGSAAKKPGVWENCLSILINFQEI